MKKIVLIAVALCATVTVFSQTVVTVREPGLIEGLVVGTGGIVSGIFGMTKELFAGRTVTYTAPAAVTTTAVPSCAVVQTTPVCHTQPVVIPSTQPVVITPSVQPVVTVQQPVVVVPAQHTTVIYNAPYKGWGASPMRPRHYFTNTKIIYPGEVRRPVFY